MPSIRFSFSLTPEHPASDLVETIVTADELGFYGCYGADQINFKDQWIIAAAAAPRTRQIILAPGVTHVILKDPVLLAQATATLDELSGGRTELAYSVGEATMLSNFHAESKRGITRLREAHAVMRSVLDTGSVDFEGEFYRYSNVVTSARPVQEHVPIKLGVMRSPKAFALGGEIADGVVNSLTYSREAIEYGTAFVREGADRADRNLHDLDLSTILIGVIAEDRDVALEAARSCVAIDLTSISDAVFERHGIDPQEVAPAVEAAEQGDFAGAARLVSERVASRLSLAGTPEDWVAHIQEQVAPTAIDHLIVALMDPWLVNAWAGRTIPGLPDQRAQLRLIHDRVMPHFA